MFLCELCLDRWRHWLRTLGLGIKRIGNINTQALFFFFALPLFSSNALYLFRSLDDVRMNFEVLKYCATVLFLVRSLYLLKIVYLDS